MKQVEYKCQGDVQMLLISNLPEGLERLEGATVAFGEHTGHNHTFYDDETATLEKFDHRTGKGSKNVEIYKSKEGSMFARILAPVFLKHHEHNTIPFDIGCYKIGITRQYDYDTEESQRVRD